MTQSFGQPCTPGRELAHFDTNTVMGTKFETTSRYTQLELIGVGVSGLVCSAKDLIGKKHVAIKKLAEPFRSQNIAAHTFREVKLLKELQHDNVSFIDLPSLPKALELTSYKISHLSDVFVSPSEDIYLVTELMATDLHTILKTKRLDDQFAQYFLYQIMRALRYVHSAGIIHRDMKPGNILVNENCDLKICDFGLARVKETQMTGYVSTRYYRAPEIMLTWKRYGEKVDIWSAGCIFAEMVIGKPLFPGKDHIDQFSVITELLGSPPENLIANITSSNTLEFVRSLPERAQRPLSSLLPISDPKEKMLQIDPDMRCSASEGLEAEYLAPYHDPTDEPVAEKKFDWDLVEADLSADAWKTLMYAEVLNFHEKTGSPTEITNRLHGWGFN